MGYQYDKWGKFYVGITPFSISDIEKDCPGINRDMIQKVLRKMRDEDKIRSTGVGWNAKWVKIKEIQGEHGLKQIFFSRHIPKSIYMSFLYFVII